MNNNLVDAVQFTCEGVISILSLFSLGVLIKENNRLKTEVKRKFYRCFVVLAIACIAGWCSLLMNGHSQNYVLLHAFIKSLDYIFFPYVCVTVADMVNYTKHRKKIMSIIIGNAIFELISIFTKWSFYIDSNYIYAAGQYHFIYHITIYISILYLALAFINYGRSFKRENLFSFISIITVLLVAVVLQEAFSIRVMFTGVPPAIILLFIHINEFSQLKFDEEMEMKNKIIATDSLTGIGSRFAYNNSILEMQKQNLPQDFVVIAADVNGLKYINDNFGHIEGDKVICAAADCLSKAFSKYGKCYRTGGDEYAIFANIERNMIDLLMKDFNEHVNNWNGGETKLSISIGYCYAFDTNDKTIDSTIKNADEKMYKSKSEYYSTSGLDRRHKQ